MDSIVSQLAPSGNGDGLQLDRQFPTESQLDLDVAVATRRSLDIPAEIRAKRTTPLLVPRASIADNA